MRLPVPYQDVRLEQSGGAKLLGQRNLTPRVVGLPVREPDDCQRQGGRGPGWMAWLTQVNC